VVGEPLARQAQLAGEAGGRGGFGEVREQRTAARVDEVCGAVGVAHGGERRGGGTGADGHGEHHHTDR